MPIIYYWRIYNTPIIYNRHNRHKHNLCFACNIYLVCIQLFYVAIMWATHSGAYRVHIVIYSRIVRSWAPWCVIIVSNCFIILITLSTLRRPFVLAIGFILDVCPKLQFFFSPCFCSKMTINASAQEHRYHGLF